MNGMKLQLSNPFAVQTPEDIDAADALALFVDVFTDFHKVLKPGHTFVHGPRGAGKSMMFRYILPDCQRLELRNKTDGKGSIADLEYFSVYIPIKLTNVKLTDLERLVDKHANHILNEHRLVSLILINLFDTLEKLFSDDAEIIDKNEIKNFYSGVFCDLLADCGWDISQGDLDFDADGKAYFQRMLLISSKIGRNFSKYTHRLWVAKESIGYDGPILGYLDFLLPLVEELKRLSFMPSGPLFLLIDDADNLNETQKTILNTWVSYRTTSDISIKASTQLNYENWLTITGQTIDSPHDYSEVNISAIYTTSKGKYLERVKEIVRKRLNGARIYVDPREFFPPDEKQEEEIEKEKESIRRLFPTEGRGYRVSDDVTRYARPNYIRRLKSASKSGPSYSYAGFDQLVHISSGIIRHFLEAASLMYSNMQSRNPAGEVTFIEPGVQDDVVRQLANQYLFSEFDKLQTGKGSEQVPLVIARKLRNLIEAMGRTFELLLVSDASERRVFSIAFSDRPDEEITQVLRLGIRYGYFHESNIGTKDGTGRTKLYILTRRLAPHFSLDPTSFSGYKFVTTKAVHEAMIHPDRLVGRVRRKGFHEVFDEGSQGSLFEDQDTIAAL